MTVTNRKKMNDETFLFYFVLQREERLLNVFFNVKPYLENLEIMTMVWPACHFQNGFLIKSIFIDFFCWCGKKVKRKSQRKKAFILKHLSAYTTFLYLQLLLFTLFNLFYIENVDLVDVFLLENGTIQIIRDILWGRQSVSLHLKTLLLVNVV